MMYMKTSLNLSLIEKNKPPKWWKNHRVWFKVKFSLLFFQCKKIVYIKLSCGHTREFAALSENLIHQTTAKNLWFGCGFSFLKKNFYNQKPNVFWWLNQPIWKTCASQIGSFSLVGFRNKKCFKPPPGKLNDLHITNARFPAIRFTVAEDKTNPSRWSTTCRLLKRSSRLMGLVT